VGAGGIFPDVKQSVREADHSSTYSAKVKNEWRYTSMAGKRDFSPTPPNGLWGSPPVQWVPGVNQPGLDAERSHPVVRLRVGEDILLHISDVMACVGKTTFDIRSSLDAYCTAFSSWKEK
jgi:hypothetical protein